MKMIALGNCRNIPFLQPPTILNTSTSSPCVSHIAARYACFLLATRRINMTENERFVSATGVELWLSPENTWGFPRKETYNSMHGCWRDLVVPNEIEDHHEVEPWSWCFSLFNGKARTRSVKRTFKLPRRKVMLTTVLKQMIEVGWLSVEESVTFDVFEVKPGLLHIEMRDDMEGWTAGEILDLPEYLWVG
ncbi:hypothetical protein BDZ89DRAFT_797420 [Hymenopellis radicata]|nr:hypothetical protein BDZ89DRAFT_797420 [Hymenopellis radicata]